MTYKFKDVLLEVAYEKIIKQADKILESIADSNCQGDALSHLRGQRAAYLDSSKLLIELDNYKDKE